MDGFKHRFLDAGQTFRATDRANDRREHMNIDIGNVPDLRYSSPWPWVLALGISLSMWAGLVWMVRLVV
jgi:hypothetical protein